MAETVGSLVDKLTISQLKTHYMGKQLEREDAAAEHKEKCRQRLAVLKEQTADLQQELGELLEGLFKGTKTLKVYRQFKMYNDPVYRSQKKA